MHRSLIETLMGAVVLSLALGFGLFAYSSSGLNKNSSDGYHITADFTNVGGVSKGSDVRIGGVKIGVVDDLSLRSDNYQAQLRLTINRSVQLPTDTTAAVVGDGLLGGKFVSLQPGGDERMLGEGERIEYTQSSVSLEELIGKFVFSAGGMDKKSEEKASATDDEPALSVP